MKLIAENGFHGAPMSMIADHAGVGAGTIYHYFENKDVLIAELYNDIEKKIYSFVTEGYSYEKPIRERFLHLLKALLGYFIENPFDFRYIEQFRNSPYGIACRRDKFLGKKEDSDVFVELVREGISQQVMKDIPLAILFDIAFGPVIFAMRDHIFNFVKLDEILISQIVEACWDGIKR